MAGGAGAAQDGGGGQQQRLPAGEGGRRRARAGGRSGLLGAAAEPGPPCPALLCPTRSGGWRGPLGPALCDAVWLRGSVRGRAWGGCRPGARERRLRCCSRAGAPTNARRYLICGVTPTLSVPVCVCLFVCVQPPAAGPNPAAIRESARRWVISLIERAKIGLNS